jgi:hypothetical protein
LSGLELRFGVADESAILCGTRTHFRQQTSLARPADQERDESPGIVKKLKRTGQKINIARCKLKSVSLNFSCL